MRTIVSMLKGFFSAPPPPGSEGADWIYDPLRHPDIARMDARELGDLPMPTFAKPAPVLPRPVLPGPMLKTIGGAAPPTQPSRQKQAADRFCAAC